MLGHCPQEDPKKHPVLLKLLCKALSHQAQESAHPSLTPDSTTYWVASSKVLNSQVTKCPNLYSEDNPIKLLCHQWHDTRKELKSLHIKCSLLYTVIFHIVSTSTLLVLSPTIHFPQIYTAATTDKAHSPNTTFFGQAIPWAFLFHLCLSTPSMTEAQH